MTTAAIRNNLHKLIDVVNDNTILKAVQTILEKEATNNIIGYSIDGKPITQELLDEELEASEQDFKNGNFLTHSQLKKEIKNWRPTKKK